MKKALIALTTVLLFATGCDYSYMLIVPEEPTPAIAPAEELPIEYVQYRGVGDEFVLIPVSEYPTVKFDDVPKVEYPVVDGEVVYPTAGGI